MRTKLRNFLRTYVEGVYTIQNGAYERNGLTAYSVGGRDVEAEAVNFLWKRKRFDERG